jgi:hypothetical protein
MGMRSRGAPAVRRWSAVIVIGLVAASLCGLDGAPDAAVRPAGGPVRPPAHGAWLGEYLKAPGLPEHVKARIEDHETKLGRRLDLAHTFEPWASEFPDWRHTWDVASGRIPFISWAKTSTKAVAAGRWDDLIRHRARALKAFGHPVLLEWFWEMNGNKNRWAAHSPEAFIAAWRHLHDLFRQEGVTNVAWVWCPGAWDFANGEAPRWYPGDTYVDWICGNDYNWAPGRRGDHWQSFETVFRPFYDWASTRGKPLMIGEYGVQERRPGEKAEWIRQARRALKTEFPAIKAVVYFDVKKRYDWRVTSSRSAFRAYRAMARDPYFRGD